MKLNFNLFQLKKLARNKMNSTNNKLILIYNNINLLNHLKQEV